MVTAVSGADSVDADSAGANSGCDGEWRVVLTVWRLTVLTMGGVEANNTDSADDADADCADGCIGMRCCCCCL